MADEKPSDAETVPAAEEDPKPEDKSAVSRKKSLGGLDPAPVLSGPRQRKKADHYQVEVKERAEFVIKAGNGTKLGEIPNVHFLLGKLKTDDELLTSLHSLLFKRAGMAHRRKKNLYEFSGLVFDDDDKEKEVEKFQDKLSKWTIPLLNSALDLFELPRGNGDEGKKESKVERLLKFLEEPKKLSEKDLAAEVTKKKDAAKAKKEKEQKGKTPKSASKGAKKSESGKESSKKRAKKEESEEEGGEEQSEGDEVEEEEVAAVEEPPKKRAKKEATGSEKKAADKKPASQKKTSAKKRKVEEDKDAADGASVDGREDAAETDELPSDEEVKEATLAELRVSDVNKTTVKDLLRKLQEKFGKDLTSKKPLVKQIAVKYANTQAAGSDEAVDGKAEEAKDAAKPVAEDVVPPAKKQKTDEAVEVDAAAAEAVGKEAEDVAATDKPTETTAADKADGAPEEVDAKEASADVMETEEGKEAEATDAPVADGNEEGTEKTVEEGKE